MSRYNSLRPGAYPISWITAAQKAVKCWEESAEGEARWVSIDWARSEYAALNRMKRLWAFRGGLAAYPEDYPSISKIYTAGMELGFRKRESFGVWDIQVCVKDGRRPLGMLQAMAERVDAKEFAKEILG